MGLSTQIEAAINSLVETLRREAPENMITFNLFVNCEERRIETAERTAEDLKKMNISMRNLRGDFIRASTKYTTSGVQPIINEKLNIIKGGDK